MDDTDSHAFSFYQHQHQHQPKHGLTPNNGNTINEPTTHPTSPTTTNTYGPTMHPMMAFATTITMPVSPTMIPMMKLMHMAIPTTLMMNSQTMAIYTPMATTLTQAPKLPPKCQVYMILAPWHPLCPCYKFPTTMMNTMAISTTMTMTTATVATRVTTIPTMVTTITQCITKNQWHTDTVCLSYHLIVSPMIPWHTIWSGTLTQPILQWTQQHLDSFFALVEMACEWNIDPG